MSLSKFLALGINKTYEYHAGQTRKGSGLPYAVHPVAVGLTLSAEGYWNAITLAGFWHDVLEDVPNVTLGDLVLDAIEIGKQSDMSVDIRLLAEVLPLLTKEPGVTYDAYLKKIKDNAVVSKIKIADMRNNLSDSPSDKQKVKYNAGIAYLEGVIPYTELQARLRKAYNERT